MEQKELKRYVRLPSGKFIDTQKPREDGLVYAIRNVDGIPNWLCLVEGFEEGCFGNIISLWFETSDEIFELLQTNDHLKIRGFLGLKRFYLDRYMAIDGEYYTRYMVENIEYMGETDGELSDCVDNIDCIFTWQDGNTLRRVWDKNEGVINYDN